MASQGSKCKENRWESSFWDVCLNADKDSVPLCKYMYIYIYKEKCIQYTNIRIWCLAIWHYVFLEFVRSLICSWILIQSRSETFHHVHKGIHHTWWIFHSTCDRIVEGIRWYKDKWSGPPFFLMGLRLFVKTHNLTYNYWKKCLLSTVTPFNLPKQVWFSSVWRNETSIGEKHVQSCSIYILVNESKWISLQT